MQSESQIPGVFGGGLADSLMHPIVAVAMLVAILCMVLIPRRYVIVPLFVALFLLPAGEELYVAGLHLYVPRIIILFGILLLVVPKMQSLSPLFPEGWSDLDKIFTFWALSRALVLTLYYFGNVPAFVSQVAFLWDTLGGYYLLRFLIRDKKDIALVLKTLAVIVGILGLAMLNERYRGQNVFGYLGGVPVVPQLRGDSIRAQGPFEHPLLAGTFAATLLPFFLWLWHKRSARLYSVVGVMGCSAMVVASASSTPLLAYLAGILGICFWPLRSNMRFVRWGALVALIAAHLAMKAPVWFLIAHVDIIAGNSGYHRAMLIDTFIRHFGDWWLIGSDKAAAWGYEMDDLCEQWVQEGERGGILTLILFIFLVSRSFSKIGKARKRLSRQLDDQWFLWITGVALFSHCVGFFGISYFDQTRYSWFVLLCIISISTSAKAARRVTAISASHRTDENVVDACMAQ